MINLIKYIFIGIILLFHYGCKSSYVIPLEEVQPGEFIQEIVFNNGDVVKFNKQGGIISLMPDRLSGLRENIKIEIPINEIKEIRISEPKTYPVDSLSSSLDYYELLLSNNEVIEKNSIYKTDVVNKILLVNNSYSSSKPLQRKLPFNLIKEVRIEKPVLYDINKIMPYFNIESCEILNKNNIAIKCPIPIKYITGEIMVQGIEFGERQVTNYPINNLHSIKVERFDHTKNWFLFVGVGASVVAIIVAGIFLHDLHYSTPLLK